MFSMFQYEGNDQMGRGLGKWSGDKYFESLIDEVSSLFQESIMYGLVSRNLV